MAGKPPASDPVQDAPEVGEPHHSAAGLPAVGHALRIAQQQMGVRRTALTLLRVNQKDGFDCPGCAWPEPDKRARRRVLRERRQGRRRGGDPPPRHARVLRRALGRRARRTQSDHWLGQQGRLTQPMYPAPRATTHYEPVAWDDAFDLIAERADAPSTRPTRRSSTPPGAPATRPRSSTSSSSASSAPTTCPTARTCATSRAASALTETIGVGKGTVTLEDFDQADLIFVVGQNPGTNHPRMLTALEKAKRGGAQIVADQPAARGGPRALQEPADARAACSAAAPRWPTCSCRSGSAATWRSSRASARRLRRSERRRPGQVARPRLHRRAHRRLRRLRARRSRRRDWDEIARAPPASSRDEIDARPAWCSSPTASIVCWAMGLTQHKNARRHHPGGRQPAAAARQHRPARRRRVPGARPQQRPGRPDHGHLRAPAARLPRRAGRGVRLRRRPASTATTSSTPSGRMRDGAGRRLLRAWAATSSPPPPTPTSPRPPCAAAGLTVHVSTKLNRVAPRHRRAAR